MQCPSIFISTENVATLLSNFLFELPIGDDCKVSYKSKWLQFTYLQTIPLARSPEFGYFLEKGMKLYERYKQIVRVSCLYSEIYDKTDGAVVEQIFVGR